MKPQQQPAHGPANFSHLKKELESLQGNIEASVSSAVLEASESTKKKKTLARRPFGYSLVEKTNTPFVFAMLGVLLVLMWWMSLPKNELFGTDTQVKFIRALSGDQIMVMTSTGDVLPVRLRMIDAPEMNQVGGGEARAFVQDLLSGNDKELVAFIWDRETSSGFYIADMLMRRDVRRRLSHVQHEIVAAGWAWQFGGFEKDSTLKRAMDDAQAARRGLWVDGVEAVMPPWKFRRLLEVSGRQQREVAKKGGKHQHGSTYGTSAGLTRKDREELAHLDKHRASTKEHNQMNANIFNSNKKKGASRRQQGRHGRSQYGGGERRGRRS
eukprot:PhM_4_TR4098/c0_g1_i1/m.90575